MRTRTAPRRSWVLAALLLGSVLLSACPSDPVQEPERRPRNRIPTPDHRCMDCPRYKVPGWEY